MLFGISEYQFAHEPGNDCRNEAEKS